jgi:hypothetical protein
MSKIVLCKREYLDIYKLEYIEKFQRKLKN